MSLATSIFHSPGDWLADATSARDRRSAATWMLIIYCLTVPLRYPYKDAVWMVWVLSEFAIIFSLLAVGAAETPAESEEEVNS